MNTFHKILFTGRLGRKHYLIALIIYSFVSTIIFQILRELESGTYILVACAVLLIGSMLQAKRFRDLTAPGKIAPIATLVFIVAWAPEVYGKMIGTVSEYASMPPFLGLMYTLLFFMHWYLLLAKGTLDENNYGKSTYQLNFLKALKNESV
ncbi:MAG: DUF805 domain-containing protein [Candidatus Pacebacteria bacterium]|nr:DUF805 domain-containing protein [Candidatus Paceibacterota bacterium]